MLFQLKKQLPYPRTIAILACALILVLGFWAGKSVEQSLSSANQTAAVAPADPHILSDISEEPASASGEAAAPYIDDDAN